MSILQKKNSITLQNYEIAFLEKSEDNFFGY